MNAIDILIGIFVIAGAWSGFRKGLIMSISKLVGYIIGLVVALAMYKPFASYLGKGIGFDSIFNHLGTVILKLPQNVSLAPMKSLSLEKVQSLIHSMNVPISGQNILNDILKQLTEISGRPSVTTVGDALNILLGELLLKIVAFSILVIAVEVVISIVVKGISKIISYSPAGLIDRGGGLVFGLGKNLILVAITLIVINPFLSLGALSKGGIGKLCLGIHQSQIATYIFGKVK
ncbi:MAG TPA: CvpA family protein [Bacillota bacterium]|nr:CvpA family protein [Bacillota bacterium]